MLDIIRKKSSAWGTKIIFGIIIVVFVFFFGYSRMSGRSGAKGGAIVARVGDHVVTKQEYGMAYDNTKKMFENMFKSQEGQALPEGLEKSVRSTALNQIIQQAMVRSLGDKMGFEPSKYELADVIRNSPIAKDETGRFDPILYKQRILPYYAQKFGVDFEDIIASDLTGEKVRQVFLSLAKVPDAREMYDAERTKWTFDVTEYDSEDNAKTAKNGKVKRVGPIKVADGAQIFGAEPDITALEKAFKISDAAKEPINVGGKWYSVKLVSVDRPSDTQWEKDRSDFVKSNNMTAEQDYFRTWLTELTKKTKIKRYIEE